jgi:hypothetical protein
LQIIARPEPDREQRHATAMTKAALRQSGESYAPLLRAR